MTSGIMNTELDIWARVDMSAGVEGCWPWRARRMRQKWDYGIVKYDGVEWLAHRLIYTFVFGPIPADKPIVCHTCDNPPCCNPSHLFAGTDLDNRLDAKRKGRTPTGERSGSAKFTWEEIRAIRFLYGSGRSQMSLAREFGTSSSNLHAIVHGKYWKDTGEKRTEPVIVFQKPL